MNQDENNPLERKLTEPQNETEKQAGGATESPIRETSGSSHHDSKPSSEPSSNKPFVGKLIEPAASEDSIAESEEVIREGSPFRVDPTDMVPVGQLPVLPSGEPAYGDFGPFQYTAMGAAASAVVVLLFAAMGAGLFPVGGILVTVLGGMLGLVGMFSTKRFRLAAILALIAHAGLFVLSYARSLV